VAQATFALLLGVTNQVGHHNRSVHQGDWQTSKDFSYWQTPLMELAGKTIGLIGYGAIAQAVATIAHAFQLKVIYFNHRPKPAQADWAKQVSLAELYQEADIISLHVPQFPETEKMIDRTALAQMKSSAILINTARGGLIDEAAVAEALKTGQIAALAADVVSKEPIAADNPLLQTPNCYLTPHIAWAPVETRRRLMGIAVANLSGFKAGTPQNVV
jgi:glycerate dehydrogenase